MSFYQQYGAKRAWIGSVTTCAEETKLILSLNRLEVSATMLAPEKNCLYFCCHKILNKGIFSVLNGGSIGLPPHAVLVSCLSVALSTQALDTCQLHSRNTFLVNVTSVLYKWFSIT